MYIQYKWTTTCCVWTAVLNAHIWNIIWLIFHLCTTGHNINFQWRWILILGILIIFPLCTTGHNINVQWRWILILGILIIFHLCTTGHNINIQWQWIIIFRYFLLLFNLCNSGCCLLDDGNRKNTKLVFHVQRYTD